MKVNFEEIVKVFSYIESGEWSREEASKWAAERRIADDSNTLEYEPYGLSKTILRSIVYIEGFDLLESPGNYFLGLDDLRRFRLDNSIPTIG